MAAERRRHPTEQRWLTIYGKDGRRVISERVPPCGDELASGISNEEMRHLAEAADKAAGRACRAGDLDRGFRLLTDARVLDPGRGELWDQHEARIRASARQRERDVTQPHQPRGPRADPEVIAAGEQEWAHWNAGLPKGLCGPEWRQCPEHGTAAVRARMQEGREREGAA